MNRQSIYIRLPSDLPVGWGTDPISLLLVDRIGSNVGGCQWTHIRLHLLLCRGDWRVQSSLAENLIGKSDRQIRSVRLCERVLRRMLRNVEVSHKILVSPCHEADTPRVGYVIIEESGDISTKC